MIRIALIDNISARGCTLVPPPFGFTVMPGNPTETYGAIANGACDAALLSVARLPDLSALVEPIGAYGIACEGAVSSVLFFSRHPLCTLLERQLPVHVTPESQTSRRLLDLLCRMDYGLSPLMSTDLDRAEGRLVIGDAAVRLDRPERQWPGLTDMSQWWYERTGLPFVFARWVVRRDLDGASKEALAAWLQGNASASATDAGRARLVERTAHCMPSQSFAQVYYRRIRNQLTLRDLRGLETFMNLLDTTESWPQTV